MSILPFFTFGYLVIGYLPLNLTKNTMKYLILILLPISLNAQSVYVSPTSVKAWGTAKHTPKAEIEYKNFHVVAFSPVKEQQANGNTYSGLFLGAFYTPIDFTHARIGFGFLNRKFPTKEGAYHHFRVELIYPISERISLSGLDNISLVINLAR
jgi:hypothetical protein